MWARSSLAVLVLLGCGGGTAGKDADTEVCPSATWFRDQDGDGFGNPDVSESACDAPLGYVADDSDCDDSSPSVSPNGVEICDPGDVDEDCNGLSDLDDPNLELATYYRDQDDDGYGDPETFQASCDTPEGYVEDHGDCDDTDDAIHPGAAELCDTSGADEDCDGAVNDADPSLDTSAFPSAWVDADHDGYGAGDPIRRCDTAGYVFESGDCDDGEAAVNPGASEVCGDGLDNNCDSDDNGCTLEGTFQAGEGTVIIRGEAGDRVGLAVSAGGDLTGDGVEDVVVGSPDAGGYGEAWVFAGPLVGALDPNDAVVLVDGANSDDQGIGEVVIAAHDWNGDGDADLLVGEPTYSPADGFGAVHLFFGPLRGNERVTSASRSYFGDSANGGLGRLATAGDFDGDGADDVLLAEAVVAGRTGYHVLYLDRGPVGSGNGGLHSSADVVYTSDNYVSQFVLSDIDGDGADELFVGSNYEGDYLGAAWILPGGSASGSFTVQDDATASFTGTAANGRVGSSVASCDLDGDGAPEVIVGAEGVSLGASSSGGAYVFPGTVSGSSALTSALATLSGVDSGDSFGARVSCLGDPDGDGAEELAVSAPYGDGAATNSGAAYLFLDGVAGSMSGADAPAVLYGDNTSDQLVTVQPLGDLGGDGRPEIAVGAPYADDPADSAGMLAVFSAGGI